MPCYSPIKGYRSRALTETGKRSIVFSPEKGFLDMPVEIPCGKCIGCRLEYSRQWAMRCVHESKLYDSNSFITLTYSDDYLPHDSGLVKKHFQDFMKRLRKRIDTESPNTKIRFFHCGEYGETTLRPHYHAIIFNWHFPDRKLYKESYGVKYYESALLDEVWGMGKCIVGDLTFESAAYVARYVVKKINGEDAERHYTRVDPETGEEHKVLPEYATMSRRPGIGQGWYENYKTDAYPSDFLFLRGVRMKPPKFYDKLLGRENPDLLLKVKSKRLKAAEQHKEDNTLERLIVKETVKKSRIKTLKRKLE